jgi:hypothetical protein
MAGRMTRGDRDARTLARRLEVLRLPVSPLRRHGYLIPSRHDTRWARQPVAVGIGPDGQALAVWADRARPDCVLVTRHHGGQTLTDGVVLDGAQPGRFVQPLPGAQVLLAQRRSRSGAGAQVWSRDGELVATGDLGDAIEDVLTTPSGVVWVSYFDEAMSGTGPQAHGLACFGANLQVEWVYPFDAGLPFVFDCYTLNVAGDTAAICPYTDFHILSVTGTAVTDHGPSPYRSAHNLLIDGRDASLLGGPSAEYDQITFVHIGPDGIEAAGEPRRLVLPDGMEVRAARTFCRGPDLHVIMGTSWYRIDLDGLRG